MHSSSICTRRSSLPYAFAWVLICLCALSAESLLANEPQVRATLSDDTIALGEATKLTIEISNGSAEVPKTIEVDGLQILHMGTSTQHRIINLQMSSSVTHTYSILPMREGTFTIPALPLKVGNKTLRTNELTLTVSGSAAPPQRRRQIHPQSPDPQPDGPSQELVEAELIIPSDKVYVGQAVPVELRVYIDARVRAEAEGAPSLQGDGFTVRSFQQPHVAESRRGNRQYTVVTFRTALTPVKAGKLSIGPGELPTILQLPRSRQGRQGFFDDDFFNDPFFNRGVQQRVKIQTEPLELEVHPLPATGRPPHFSGAVGQFELRSDVSPKEGLVGDPLTIRSTITGRGDFDRVPAPQLENSNDLRMYPATDKFTPNDDLGLSGSKEFEQVIIPEGPRNSLPPVQFSYFDPIKEQYVNLSSPPFVVKITGERAAASPTPAQPTPEQSSPPPTPEPTPTQASDILHILETAGPEGSFDPPYKRTGFLLVNAAAALAVLTLLALGMAKRHRAAVDPRRARLDKEFSEQRRKALASDPATDPAPAVRALQTAAALKAGGEPGAVDADMVIQAFQLDGAEEEAVRTLFDTYEAVRFGGASANLRAAGEFSSTILHILKKLRK